MSLQLLPSPQKPLDAEGPTAAWELESARQVQRRLMQVRRPLSAALEYDGRCLPATTSTSWNCPRGAWAWPSATSPARASRPPS